MSSQGDNQEPGRGDLSPEERDAFKKRASELGARLDRVRAEERAKIERSSPTPDDGTRGVAFGLAMKIGIELVVGIVVGGFIGKVLDGYFGTAPWLLIVFLIIGFAAGIMNIVRAARRLQAAAEPLQRQGKPVADDRRRRELGAYIG